MGCATHELDFLKDLQPPGRLRADVVTGVLGMRKFSLILHAELGESSSSFTAEHPRFHRTVSAASLDDLTDDAREPVPERRGP
jgi:hypothetical protein